MVRSLFLFLLFISDCVFPQVISLRDTTNQYDYVVITTPDLITSCESFKQHKETLYGIKVLLADTTMIYNEFDTASTKAGNIREFISYAGTYWKIPQPRFFLLAGNASKIPDNIFTFSNFGIIHTDFYYSQSIYDQDSLTVEFYVGRVPATNSSQLDTYFSKLISYENDNNPAEWRNRALFISEYDPSNYYTFDSTALHISQNHPLFITPDYLAEEDSLHPEQYRDQLINKINQNGCSSVRIMGRSRDTAIGYSQYFSLQDIGSLNNSGKPFAEFFMNTQDRATKNLLDAMILSDNGALRGIAAVAPSFYLTSQMIFESYIQKIYSNDVVSIGQLVDYQPNYGFFAYEKYKLNLWGDPSLKIKFSYPTNVEESGAKEINNFNLSQNFPNPFNPVTTINYTVLEDGSINLTVYDLLGKEVRTLVNGYSKKGEHQIVIDASELGSGMYFYKLLQGNSVLVKKMILLK